MHAQGSRSLFRHRRILSGTGENGRIQDDRLLRGQRLLPQGPGEALAGSALLRGREGNSSAEVDWFKSADCITAGFPCQDISYAGDGAGLAGERSGLWWQVRRALRMVRPRIALLENVAALLNRGMGTVLGSLAQIGYDAEWHCIPAAAVDAEHERDRVWIVASDTDPERQLQPEGRQQDQRRRSCNGPEEDDAHSHRARRARWRKAGTHRTHAGDLREGLRLAIASAPAASREYWDHQPVLGGRFHGVPDRLDRIGALGNSVFPAIPELLGQAIIESAP